MNHDLVSTMSAHEYPEIFSAREDSQMNACLSFSHDMSYGYVEGYLRAADRVIGRAYCRGRKRDRLACFDLLTAYDDSTAFRGMDVVFTRLEAQCPVQQTGPTGVFLP